MNIILIWVRRSTLSVGIAIAKPKHPIQLLKEGAEFLLNKSKSEARTHMKYTGITIMILKGH